MKFKFSKEFCSRMAEIDDGEDVSAGLLAQLPDVSLVQLLKEAWEEGWRNCRDSEFVGQEAMNNAYNHSDTLAMCLDIEQVKARES